METREIVLSPQDMQVLKRLLALGRDFLEEEYEEEDFGGLTPKTQRTWQDRLHQVEEAMDHRLNESASEYVIPKEEGSWLYNLARYGYMEYVNGIGEPCSQKEWDDLKQSKMFGDMLTTSQRVLHLLAPLREGNWLTKQLF